MCVCMYMCVCACMSVCLCVQEVVDVHVSTGGCGDRKWESDALEVELHAAGNHPIKELELNSGSLARTTMLNCGATSAAPFMSFKKVEMAYFSFEL